jgi:cbb3-type cytochrome oxidase maturation protein
MTALAWLIPAALFLGALGLAGFLWSLKSGQFEDLEGAGWRALDDDPDSALPPEPPARAKTASEMTNG